MQKPDGRGVRNEWGVRNSEQTGKVRNIIIEPITCVQIPLFTSHTRIKKLSPLISTFGLYVPLA